MEVVRKEIIADELMGDVQEAEEVYVSGTPAVKEL